MESIMVFDVDRVILKWGFMLIRGIKQWLMESHAREETHVCSLTARGPIMFFFNWLAFCIFRLTFMRMHRANGSKATVLRKIAERFGEEGGILIVVDDKRDELDGICSIIEELEQRKIRVHLFQACFFGKAATESELWTSAYSPHELRKLIGNITTA